MTFADLARLHVPSWRQQRHAADLTALDTGEIRTVMVWFRGLYGSYSTRWHFYFADLTREELVLRRRVPFRGEVRIPVTEQLVSAWLRAPASLQEGLRIGASGQYAPGGSLEAAGHQIVSCKTTEGVLEFAVRHVDVPLLLQYVTMKAQTPHSPGGANKLTPRRRTDI
jgi:hypothetical protein